ncbi:enoyl-CoA hydratase/isomerase family protein [Aspergillus avenaceus]|uniref:Enoyl-CoA hydratase/isomerase family protein n=1 Tax=Aspergillus avenaceus TaxID=36643 RepID=A0A5N6TR08_ASPAV|nr:enoyl-CoA hydratase/isomerase family protein [Aspergillus avenaceus]
MSSEVQPVLVSSREDGITILSLNWPHRRNAIDPIAAKCLFDKLLAFENDPSQKVCILTGVGGTFCAGFDLFHSAASSDGDKKAEYDSKDEGYHFSTPPESAQPSIGPLGPTRQHVKKPLICAIAGYAVGGGLELSLLCDIRVVEEDAVFGIFSRRWGIPLLDGSTVRLQAVVGLGRALDIILTGRSVDANEALTMGLANRVVSKGKALEEAIAIAKQLVSFPQQGMNADRNSCYYSAYDASSFHDGIRQEYEKGKGLLDTKAVSAVTQFRQGAGRHGGYKRDSHL